MSVRFSAFIVAETSDTYRFLSEENTKLQSEVSQYKVALKVSCGSFYFIDVTIDCHR